MPSYTSKELRGSGTISGDKTYQTATRIFWVTPYTSAMEFVRDKLGRSRTAGTSITKIPPEKFAPDTKLFASTFQVEGLGKPTTDGSGNASYTGGAKVTIVYQPKANPNGFDFLGQQGEITLSFGNNLSMSLEVTGEVIAYGRGKWKWFSDNKVISEGEQSLARISVNGMLRITRWSVPNVNLDVVAASLGKVNSNAITGAGGTFGVKTLLFTGVSTTEEYDEEGVPNYDIVHNFAFQRIGWNNMYRQSTGLNAAFVDESGADMYSTFTPADLIPELGKFTI